MESEEESFSWPRLAVKVFGASLLAGLCYLTISLWSTSSLLDYLPQVLLLVCVTYIVMTGAEVLVASATALATALGVSQIIIGLTIVAFGTSAPEMAASLVAGFQGKGDITIANVIGSNIFNLCFILGGVAVLVPDGLRCDETLVRRDGPVLLLSTVLLFLHVGSGLSGSEVALLSSAGILNLSLERWEGFFLFSVLLVYIYLLFLKFRQSVYANVTDRDTGLSQTSGTTYLGYAVGIVIGLVLVIAGCHVMVGTSESLEAGVKGYGALWFAEKWGVPDYVVGVTIVAAGTSAPEFIVSLIAALRGSYGISAGNLLGSDIFNILGVVGLSGLILQPPLAPAVSVSPAVGPTLLALTAVVLCVVFFMHTGGRVSRREGAILLTIGLIRWVAEFTGY